MFDVLEKITSLREERGWTTYRLSKLSGIPQSTISTWYRKNLMPPIDKLEIICQTFGITLAEFFNDTDVLVSMTEEEKKYVVTVESADSCSESSCDKYYRSATVQ